MAPSIATAEDVSCAALASFAEADTDIARASFVEAGFDEDAEGDLPACCRVDGIIDARTGEGGAPFGKTFELRED